MKMVKSIEREYTLKALQAIEPWAYLLPTDVQRAVRLALSVIESHALPTSEELEKQIGGHNWVIARRTRYIERKYGVDVITLSPKQYADAQRRAIESRF